VSSLRFRRNESPICMLNNLEAMGRPVRVSSSESGNAGVERGGAADPVPGFNFTSLSEAV